MSQELRTTVRSIRTELVGGRDASGPQLAGIDVVSWLMAAVFGGPAPTKSLTRSYVGVSHADQHPTGSHDPVQATPVSKIAQCHVVDQVLRSPYWSLAEEALAPRIPVQAEIRLIVLLKYTRRTRMGACSGGLTTV